MKQISVLMILLFVTGALFAQEAKQVNVKYVQNQAGPYENVILQGNITHQLDGDEFILSDSTGSVKVELEGPAKRQYYKVGQDLMGATVRVYGLVDKDHQWDNAEVKVLKMRIVSQAPQQSAPTDPDLSADSASDEVNMQGRDDIAEAFGSHRGSAVNIPDNF